jgi:hypothetical protein
MSALTPRRDRRYEAKIPVTLLSLRGDTELVTQDVSYRGLFLETTLVLPKRELLRVRLSLPNQAESIQTNVVVVSARAGGVGVSFYGLDGQARTRWEKFVESMRDQHPSAVPISVRSVSRMRRGGKEVTLAAASVPAFERISDDVQQGAVLVHGAETLDIDAPVSVRVVHPVTHGAFLVEGVVARRLSGGGVSVKTSMDTGTRASLRKFVQSARERDSVDIVDFESAPPSAPPG